MLSQQERGYYARDTSIICKMKIKEILKRINGFSTPIFGLSWNPNNTDKDHVKEIIAFLEDKRVLYNPSEMEIPSHCVDSILEIRRFLTLKIGVIKDEKLILCLKNMRASCRKFLDTVGAKEDIVRFGNDTRHWASWLFNSAIGELRGVFGIYLAQIVITYNISIEDSLATILPVSDISETE